MSSTNNNNKTKNNIPNTEIDPIPSTTTNSQSEIGKQINTRTENTTPIPSNGTEASQSTILNNKRPASSTIGHSSECSQDDQSQNVTSIDNITENPQTKQNIDFKLPLPSTKASTKKFKRSESTDNATPLIEILSSIEKHIQETTPPFVLTFKQFYDFLENVQGNANPLGIASEYTNNIPALLDMLKKLHPLITHKNTKNRITRLTKKIQKQFNNKDTDFSGNDTDTSQQSSY